MKFRISRLIASVFMFSAICNATAQEAYPSKPISLITGFAGGGVADATARYVAEAASKYLGQPIIVKYKLGASGVSALVDVQSAPADGYTIGMLATGAIISSHMQKLPIDPTKDFTPVIQIGEFVLGLAVQSNSPFKSVQDLVEFGKANPGKVSYSTSGPGSPQHLVMAELGQKTGATFTHAPTTGGPPAINLLLGGHVTAASQGTDWKPYVQAGQFRLLAVYTSQRLEEFPEVPTLVEAGGPAGVASIWSIVGPRGMPKDRVEKLHDALQKAMQEPGYKALSARLTFKDIHANSADLQKRILQIHESAGRILAGIPK